MFEGFVSARLLQGLNEFTPEIAAKLVGVVAQLAGVPEGDVSVVNLAMRETGAAGRKLLVEDGPCLDVTLLIAAEDEATAEAIRARLRAAQLDGRLEEALADAGLGFSEAVGGGFQPVVGAQPPPPPAAPQESGNSLPVGIIAGVVAGVVAVLVLILLVCLLRRRRRQQREKQVVATPGSPTGYGDAMVTGSVRQDSIISEFDATRKSTASALVSASPPPIADSPQDHPESSKGAVVHSGSAGSATSADGLLDRRVSAGSAHAGAEDLWKSVSDAKADADAELEKGLPPARVPGQLATPDGTPDATPDATPDKPLKFLPSAGAGVDKAPLASFPVDVRTGDFTDNDSLTASPAVLPPPSVTLGGSRLRPTSATDLRASRSTTLAEYNDGREVLMMQSSGADVGAEAPHEAWVPPEDPDDVLELDASSLGPASPDAPRGVGAADPASPEVLVLESQQDEAAVDGSSQQAHNAAAAAPAGVPAGPWPRQRKNKSNFALLSTE